VIINNRVMNMKTREDAARFIEAQFIEDNCRRNKGDCWHYGWQELRDLMDFIYMAEPLTDKEMLVNNDKYRKKEI
jgi:hypothetical protein|tara:strand:- start:344 stop:568 length:225 start_codon:yes stop_codon:yes gene_type:complete